MKQFEAYAAVSGHKNWEKLIRREDGLYDRKDDVRSAFARDYTRILHCPAYRRLKHKTQVFYNVGNDHICTRMEHVAHVESVSQTIAKSLGLNDELTKAIAMGHDLGHAPFGHQGETWINDLSKKYVGDRFWHEKNSLRFIDDIELLEDNYKKYRNLQLTYAVRDGIVSHCGEVDENGLKPRDELMELSDYDLPGKYMPVTWEGCVVKISDKIAYLGRDIEDAINLGFLDDAKINELLKMARSHDENVLNTTVIMHNLIIDICENSSPETGITLSEEAFSQMNALKHFNYDYIYKHPRFKPFIEYSKLVINELFEVLYGLYDGRHTFGAVKEAKRLYHGLMSVFEDYLLRYVEEDILPKELLPEALNYENKKIYGRLETKEIYARAVLDFISGMTDRFAIKCFEELLRY